MAFARRLAGSRRKERFAEGTEAGNSAARYGDSRVFTTLINHFKCIDKDTKIKGLAAPSVLTMNQTLEGHHRMYCLLFPNAILLQPCSSSAV